MPAQPAWFHGLEEILEALRNWEGRRVSQWTFSIARLIMGAVIEVVVVMPDLAARVDVLQHIP